MQVYELAIYDGRQEPEIFYIKKNLDYYYIYFFTIFLILFNIFSNLHKFCSLFVIINNYHLRKKTNFKHNFAFKSVFVTELTFGLEREVAVRAVKWTDVRMSTDVFPQHARFLAADSTFLTDVFSSSTPSNVHILLIRLVTENIPQISHFRTQCPRKYL